MPRQREIVKSWWDEKAKVHQTLVQHLNQLDTAQDLTYRRDLAHYSKYQNRTLKGLRPGAFEWSSKASFDGGDAEGTQTPVNLNLSRSVVDSSQARICPNKPRVRYMTDGGNWFLQERAIGMQRAFDGWMEEVDGYRALELAALDSKVFGIGYVCLQELDDRLEMEHVFKPEITVDEQASLTSQPRTMYRRKLMAAEHAVGKYAYPKGKYSEKLATAILSSTPTTRTTTDARAILTTVDLVEIIEAVHLPSRRGGKDGRRVVAVDTATLVDEKWELDFHPWVPIEWSDDTAGYCKPGLVEEVEGIQEELTKIAREVQGNFEMLGGAWVRTREGTVPDEWITNERYRHVKGEPGDMEVITPSPVNPIFLQYEDALIAWGYDFTGVSKMEATSSQPQHQLSGKAIREYRDNASGRFAMKERAWERYGLDVAKVWTAMMRRVAQRHPNTKLWYQSSTSLERLDWKDIELPEDDYRLATFPVGSLPREPSARIQTVQEWVGAGLVDGETAMQLLDFPDLQKAQSVKLSALRHAQWVMDSIVYKRRVTAPDPIMDLPFCIKWARSTYLYVQMHGSNTDDKEQAEHVQGILNDLGGWILQAKALAKADAQAMMAEQAAMMPPPGPGGGEAPLAPGTEPPPMATGGVGIPPGLG